MKNCYLCGASLNPTFQKRGCQFWSCPQCYLECIDPQPDNTVLGQIYGEEYYEDWGLSTSEPLVIKIKQQTFAKYLSWLLKPRPVDTPDVGSYSHHLMRTRWTHYKFGHLWYFNRNNLSALLREMAFTIVCAQAAPKNLSLQYVFHQFKIYPHPVITPIFSIFDRLLPAWAKQIRVTLPLGDILLVGHV